MYIRTRQDALDALAEVLALEDRTAQIVQVTVKIALCLDPDPRNFLVDCQHGIISDGLMEMAQRRHEAVAALKKEKEKEPEEVYDGIIIVDEKDDLLEGVGTALDTLRVTEIVREVFPELAEWRDRWQISRAILADEGVVREALVAAVRGRHDDVKMKQMEAMIDDRIEANLPGWADVTPTVREICKLVIDNLAEDQKTGTPADDPDLLYNVIAMSEERVSALLDLAKSDGEKAAEYVNEIRTRIKILHDAEALQM